MIEYFENYSDCSVESNEVALAVLLNLLQNDNRDGFTLANKTIRSASYVVSVANLYTDNVLPDYDDLQIIANRFLSLRETNPYLSIGYWVDSDTGFVYYDANIAVTERENALSIARQYAQIAIWDIVNAREVRVNYE